jgi:hypothetical protein
MALETTRSATAADILGEREEVFTMRSDRRRDGNLPVTPEERPDVRRTLARRAK